MASVRLRTLSLVKILRRCDFTVVSLMKSAAPIFADALKQFFARCILEQISPRAHFDGAMDFVVGIEGGQHDDARGWIGAPDFLDCAHAIQHRHPQVEQRDVGPHFAPALDGFAAIVGFGDHRHVDLPPDDRGDAFEHGDVIVGDQDANPSRPRHV